MVATDPMHCADIAPVIIRLLVEKSRVRGKNPSELLRGMGLELADLQSGTVKVSYRQCLGVVRRFWSLIPDLDVGLKVGTRLHVVSLGKVGLGMMASPSLHDMIQFLIEFQHAAGYLLELHSEISKQDIRISAHPFFNDPDTTPFLIIYTLVSLNSLIEQVVGHDFRPLRVELTLPRAANVATYEQVFRCPVNFGRSLNQIVLPPDETRIKTAEPSVFARMRELLQATCPHDDYSSAVALAIHRNLADTPSISDIARSLNMSERSLRRKLQDEGLTYREIVERERCDKAMELINLTDIPVAEIAEQTGYSSSRNLRRAVNRWVGSGPSSLRQASQHKHEEEGQVSSGGKRTCPYCGRPMDVD